MDNLNFSIMKLKMKFKNRPVAILVTVCMLLVAYSCNEESAIAPTASKTTTTETLMPDDANVTLGSDEDSITLTPKILARIRVADGSIVSFRSERDGVVYEENGSSYAIGRPKAHGILERFLALTNESIAVPRDLMVIESDTRIKEIALRRGLTEQHEGILSAITQTDEILAASAWCSGGPSYYDTDAYGQFYRTFTNHSWGIAGTTVYSSWKSGADKCKTINLYFVNCSSSNTLSADTWYKNVFGNYKKQDVINVGAGNSKFWSKTYVSKRNRRVFVSGFGSGKFGGYVLFRDY
jgi:hypothetical protein